MSTPEHSTATTYQNLTVGPNGPVRQLTSTSLPQPQPNYVHITPNTSPISANSSVSCVPEARKLECAQLDLGVGQETIGQDTTIVDYAILNFCAMEAYRSYTNREKKRVKEISQYET